MPKFDRTKFFAGVRDFLKSHGQQLTQKRTDALEFLITSFENTAWSVPRISYALATIYHETAHTFEPIYEYGPKSYFNKYEPGTRIGKNLGNTEKGDGWRYRGAGYVQITGRSNYRKFRIEEIPHVAIQHNPAFAILREGMEKGLFTGHKLSDYISDTGKDYKNARKIINGLDKASLIAGYANQFEQILRDSKTSTATLPATDKPIENHTDKISETADKLEGLPSDSGERPTLNVENIENAKIEAPKPAPQTSPVTVTAERVSVFAKIGAAFTAITALGINLGNVSTTKLNELTPQQIVWLVGACLLFALALWFYDRAAKRAHEKTLAKMKTASDPAQNTVELREQK